LPRDIENYDIPDAERQCSCGCTLTEIGEETSEQVIAIPFHCRVLKKSRTKYVCRGCGTFKTADAPPSIIPGSTYGSAEFSASIVTSKCQYGLTLYRLETMLHEDGIPVDRTTLARLMGTLGEKCEPLWLQLKEALLEQVITHADETTIQVLKEPGRKAQTDSWMWMYRSSEAENNKVVLFDYQQTRSSEHPERFFKTDDAEGNNRSGTLRYIHVDGYSGYNKISDQMRRVGCWAHARRKFHEAMMAVPEQDRGNALATEMIELIQGLYAIEKKIAKWSDTEKATKRQAEASPILEEIKIWLDRHYPDVVPKSLLGKAIGYALAQWPTLVVYVEDGRLAIDNNVSEREIKSFVIPRKNFLFADTPQGAKSLAILHSLVRTAVANGLKPYQYLKHIFTELPKLSRADEVATLLPWNLPAHVANL
jgi:transposase